MVLLVVLALWGLTNKEAWQDEAISVVATNQLLTTLEMTSGTMATYYLNLLAWVQVSDSLWWIRLLSVIHGACALGVVGVLAFRQRGASVARWTCLFMAASFLMVRYAQEARAFMLATLVVSAAWWALDHIMSGGGRRFVVIHVVLCALAPATHGLAVVAILAQVVAVVLAGGGLRPMLRVLPGQLATLGVVGYLYSYGASTVGAGKPIGVDTGRDILEQTHGGPAVWEAVDVVDFADLRWLLLGISLAGIVVGLRRALGASPGVERFRALTPTAWAVGVIGGLAVLSISHPSMLDRYAVTAVPAIAMLQADAALAAQRRVGRLLPGEGRWRFAPVIPLLVLGLLLTGQIPLHEEADNPWHEIAAVLESEARNGDGMVVPQRSLRIPLDYNWSQMDGDLPRFTSVFPTHPLGELKRYDVYQSWDDVEEDLKGLNRFWLLETGREQRHPSAQEFMALSEVAHFEVVEEHRARGLVLRLLERTS